MVAKRKTAPKPKPAPKPAAPAPEPLPPGPICFAEDLNTAKRRIALPVDAAGNPDRRYTEIDGNSVKVYEIAAIDPDGVRTYRHVSTERLT